jgi:hypothetical protein
MNIRHTLLILPALIPALLGGCTGFDPNAYVPGLYTSTPSLVETFPVTPSPSGSALAPATEIVDAPATKVAVCTNAPGGKLNVRFAPGEKSGVRGYLAEGEAVTPSGERQDVDGSVWIKLSSPIEGWVNGKYLCEVKP